MQCKEQEYKNLTVHCVATLLKVLKESFHLRFGKGQNANAKYRDPSFNENRPWVSRLLVQLFLEDAVVISVDESNFRRDYLPTKQWIFNSATLHKESRGIDSFLTPSVGKTQVLVTDDVIQYAEMLAGYPNI